MVAFEHRADNNLAILETNGYYLYFCFDFSENIGNNLVSTEIRFFTKPEISQEVCVKSERFKMNFNDIKRLSNYFKNHIKTLKTNVNSESHTFVDYSLTYQIQALCGFVSSDKNVSYFTISSMVNVGKTNTSNFSTYIGGESTISFNQVENFINSLEDVISYRLCKLENRDTIIDNLCDSIESKNTSQKDKEIILQELIKILSIEKKSSVIESIFNLFYLAFSCDICSDTIANISAQYLSKLDKSSL